MVCLGSIHLSTLPHAYQFRLGGHREPSLLPYREDTRTSFFGYFPSEFLGRQIQLLAGGVHYYFTESMVAGIQGNVGGVYTEPGLQFSGQRYRAGYGVSAAYLSILGPLEFSLQGGSDHVIFGHVMIGFDF
jgi:hypothetical protein